MFCPRCGKESDGICIDCLLKEKPIFMKKIELKICKCGRFYYGGRWNPWVEIDKIIRENLVCPDRIGVENLSIRKRLLGDRIHLNLRVEGKFEGKGFVTEICDEIKINRTACPICSRQQYYEAILQFRTNYNPLDEIDGEFISKIEKLQNGFDIYIKSSQYARKIRKRFEKMGFITRESEKLIGKKDGRNVYRLSISIKESEIKKGDIIMHKGNLFRVIGIGRRFVIENIVTGKRSSIDRSNLRTVRVIAKNEDLMDGIITNITPREIQILEESSNRTYEIERTERFDRKLGSKVKMVVVKGRAYIL